MLQGNWYMFPPKSEGEKSVGVEIRRVDPLLPVKVAIGSQQKRPQAEIIEQKMPDGSIDRKPNLRDPKYRQDVAAYRKAITLEVANAMLRFGVHDESRPVLDGRPQQDVADVLNAVRQRSGPTEESIQSAMDILDPLIVEGLMAWKFFGGTDPSAYLKLEVSAMNAFIAAYRYAQVAMTPRAQPVQQQRSAPPSIEPYQPKPLDPHKADFGTPVSSR